MKFHASITEDDMENGKCGDPRECAAAIAINRSINTEIGHDVARSSVIGGWFHLWAKGDEPREGGSYLANVSVGNELRAFVAHYDGQCDGRAEPTEFDFEIPDDVVEQLKAQGEQR